MDVEVEIAKFSLQIDELIAAIEKSSFLRTIQLQFEQKGGDLRSDARFRQ